MRSARERSCAARSAVTQRDVHRRQRARQRLLRRPQRRVRQRPVLVAEAVALEPAGIDEPAAQLDVVGAEPASSAGERRLQRFVHLAFAHRPGRRQRRVHSRQCQRQLARGQAAQRHVVLDSERAQGVERVLHRFILSAAAAALPGDAHERASASVFIFRTPGMASRSFGQEAVVARIRDLVVSDFSPTMRYTKGSVPRFSKWCATSWPAGKQT
ncbi:MAG: hypothetical protein U1F25_04290 [Rubrivivax sp.]